MKIILFVLSLFVFNNSYANVECEDAIGLNANISAALIFNLSPEVEISDISAQHAIRSSQALKSAALATCVSIMAEKYKSLPLQKRLEKINTESNEVLADFMSALVTAIPNPTSMQEALIIAVSEEKNESAEFTLQNIPSFDDLSEFSDNW